MGVLNVTPDSFSDGGKFFTVDAAVKQAHTMVKEGADSIDVGGESSRPGAAPVSEDEEIERVLPIIERLAKEIDVPISIDTVKPHVANEALSAGATMINDISGFRNNEMIQVAASHDVPVVLMHMQGDPQTMQAQPRYTDVVNDINTFFTERIALLLKNGVRREHIILDPGIGFGKTLEHNLEILRRCAEFTTHGYPVLVGASRKSFIEKISGLPVEERLEGSLAAHCVAALNGAAIVRVHDVQAHRRALDIIDAIKHA